MIRAKEPQIVISCFWTETGNNTVKNLRRRKIGHSSEFDPQGSKLAELGLLLMRVNALHPSYAINYYPEFSCFKRLLVLGFVKAFTLWQGRWTDESWMAQLRHECHEQAEKLREGMCTIQDHVDMLRYRMDLRQSGYCCPRHAATATLAIQKLVSKIMAGNKASTQF